MYFKRMTKRLSNISLTTESGPVKYHFVEAVNIANLHDSIKREDLPSGTLKPGSNFRYTDVAHPIDPLNSVCFLVRAQSGKLLASSCDASGVVLRVDAKEEKKPPVKRAGGYVLGAGERSRVHTIADFPDQPLEVKVRHVIDNGDGNKRTGIIGSLILFIIFFIVGYLISDWILGKKKRSQEA